MGDVADPNIESIRIPGMYISQSFFRFFLMIYSPVFIIHDT